MLPRFENAAGGWSCVLLQRRWVEGKRIDTRRRTRERCGKKVEVRREELGPCYIKSGAECVSVLCSRPLLKAAGAVLVAHTVDSAATGFNKGGWRGLDCAPMHGLLKRNESLMRWQTPPLSISDGKEASPSASRRGHVAGFFSLRRQIPQITQLCNFGRSQQDSRTLSRAKWLLSFFSYDCRVPWRWKERWLTLLWKCGSAAVECRSKHSSKWPIRGTEWRQNIGYNYSAFHSSFM